MEFCPTCKGVGRTKQKPLDPCMDCDGKGMITENQRKFIEYYHNRKKLYNEIEKIEKETITEKIHFQN